jgi:hypothetical protein
VDGGGWHPTDDPPADRPLEIEFEDDPVDLESAAGPGARPWSRPGAETRARVSTGAWRRPRRLVLVVAVVGALVAAAAALGVGRTVMERAGRDGGAGEPTSSPTFAVDERASNPDQAVAQAALMLEQAGSFAYHGEVRADAATPTRPGPVFDGTVTVDGSVSLPSRSIETAVGEAGAVETLISGRGVWTRQAADVSGLAAAEWTLAHEGDVGMGVTGLSDWLRATAERREGTVDIDGRRSYMANLRSDTAMWLLGGASDAVGGVTVIVDPAGAPARVKLAAAGGGRVLELTLELDGLGEPVHIAPPGGRELGITPAFTVDDLVAGGLLAPVQLHHVPPGWMLASASLEGNTDAGCPRLMLGYGDVGHPNQYLVLTVTNPGCAGRGDATGAAEPLGGGWSARLAYENAAGAAMLVSDGATEVEVDSSLTLAQLRPLIASLGRYDQLGQPSLTAARAGLPSP